MSRTRRVRVVYVCLVGSLLVAGCGSGSSTSVPPKSQGPPTVQPEVVEEHAGQLDEALAERPAGSQQEFAAATYILGHLQTAGYVPLLDPVPVEDTVRSTNVVAAPPLGAEPNIVVTVAYDTGPGAERTGEALGLWLELARALYARDQEHTVEFVALGAEHADIGDGNLGSRRLIELLRADDIDPLVIEVADISSDTEAAVAYGPEGKGIVSVGASLGISTQTSPSRTEVGVLLARAGLDHIEVRGGVDEVSEVLLEYLVRHGA